MLEEQKNNGMTGEGVGNSSIGQMLINARQNERQLSLETVADELCIKPRLLEALEKDNYDVFSSPCYASGFLKSYASYLDLDTSAILAKFKAEHSECHDEPTLVFPEAPAHNAFSIQRVATYAAFSLVLIIGVWFSVSKTQMLIANHFPKNADDFLQLATAVENSKENEVTYVKNELDLQKTDNNASQKSSSEELVEVTQVASLSTSDFSLIQEAKASTNSDIDKAVNDNPKMVLVALEDAWLKISGPNEIVIFDRVILKGEEFAVPEKDGLKLMTSDASALKLKLGGKLINGLGKRGEILNNLSLVYDELMDRTENQVASAS